MIEKNGNNEKSVFIWALYLPVISEGQEIY